VEDEVESLILPCNIINFLVDLLIKFHQNCRLLLISVLTNIWTGLQHVITYATVHGLIIGWDLRTSKIAWKLKNNPKHGKHSRHWLTLVFEMSELWRFTMPAYIILFNCFIVTIISPLSCDRQHMSYGGCVEVKREYYQNCSVLYCL